MTDRSIVDAPLEPWIPDPDGAEPWTRSVSVRWAYAMSWIIAMLMVVVSVAGLLVDGLYEEGPWAREALRGGDLVTLVLVAPLLVVALVFTWRGSRRAPAVWMGALAYSLYDYAYYMLGSRFNDVFLLHIALFSLSAFALACALPNLLVAGSIDPLRPERSARWVGGFLAIVGMLQGLLWLFVVVRNALTGEVIQDIPVAGQHLVFALDLGLLVPSLVVAGVMMFRRTATGFLLGAAMTVMGAAYQLNLMVGGVFQSNANVPGVTAFPPESIFPTAAFLLATAFVLVSRQPEGRDPTRKGSRGGLAMRLTWRDGFATILVAVVGVAGVAATESWGWPLLGSYRTAVVVMALIGLGACSIAGGGREAGAKQPPTFQGPLGRLASVLHVGVFALIVIGLLAPTAVTVLALAGDILALWLVGTIHHISKSVTGRRARSRAGEPGFGTLGHGSRTSLRR